MLIRDYLGLWGQHDVVRLPRPMDGNGGTPFFRSLQHCQFHHMRLETLEHFNAILFLQGPLFSIFP